VFAWNRPDHFRRVIDSLLTNPMSAQSDLYIFVDGPRKNNDAQFIGEVIRIANSIRGFKSVHVSKSPINMGLSRSITSGVSSVLVIHEDVIVLEDDIVVSENFLEFMNSALRAYRDDVRVASIHGYMYPHSDELPQTFFIRGSDCWGWATWRRAWNEYRSDGAQLLRELELSGEIGDFDFGVEGTYSGMLKDQIAGKNDSWAVRWYASTYLAGLFTLFPGHSLVSNIGNDGSGSHGGTSRSFDIILTTDKVSVEVIEVAEDESGRKAIGAFFLEQESSRPFSEVRKHVRSLFRGLWLLLPAKRRSWIARKVQGGSHGF
jgi:hypothetical protein